MSLTSLHASYKWNHATYLPEVGMEAFLFLIIQGPWRESFSSQTLPVPLGLRARGSCTAYLLISTPT